MTILILIDCTFQLLKDRQLLLMIGGLFVIDCAIVVIWITVDSLERKVIKFAFEVGAHQYDTKNVTLINRNRSKFGPASSPTFNHMQHCVSACMCVSLGACVRACGCKCFVIMLLVIIPTHSQSKPHTKAAFTLGPVLSRILANRTRRVDFASGLHSHYKRLTRRERYASTSPCTH